MSRHAVSGLLVMLALFTGCSGKGAPPVPETADAAVLQVTEGLADGHPEVVWHALPASYQDDLTGLVHDFAGKMDEELWNRTFGVVQKATRVLDEKRGFILDHPMLAAQIEDRKEADEAFDAVVGILEVVAKSEISDLDKMKKLDIEKFLSGTGGKLFKEFKRTEAFASNQTTGSLFGLSDAKATLISSEGDRARLKLEVPGQPATEEDYVRVEGKWIPAEMAAEWDKTISEARAQLDSFSGEEIAKNKPMVMMQLTMVEGVLDQLLATKSAEQFHTAFNGVMGMAMGAMMAQAEKTAGSGLFGSSSNTSLPMGSSSSSFPVLNAAPQEPAASVPSAAEPVRGKGIESLVGERVRVTERNGRANDGYLVDLTDDILFLEKRIGNDSSMTVEMRRSRIDSVTPIR